MRKSIILFLFVLGRLSIPAFAEMTPAMNIGLGVDMVMEAPLEEPRDGEFKVRAFELNFGAPVDPYFDALVTVGWHDDEFDLEEAWVSSNLPFNTKVQFGREFLPFGYLNRVHEHDFPQIDHPYVIEGLTTDHGMIGDGGHLEYLFPFINPTLTLNLGVYQQIHHSVGRRMNGTPLMGRLQSYMQSMDGRHEILYGASYLGTTGDRDFLSGRDGDRRGIGRIDNMFSLDAKYKFSPGGATYRGLTIGAEYLMIDYSANEDNDHYDLLDGNGLDGDEGFYVYAGWNFNRFWGVGYRFDNSDPLLDGLGDRGMARKETTSDKIIAHSVYGEWRATEFSRLRLQYKAVDEPGKDVEHIAMLQGVFFLGWHPPHRF
ncbi:hypothetical protein [Chitinivibrio alkaliphilus]|uniref:Phosphate-selective porin O and P n=1 Tax=Chitinivibrio alkaliphilus ACht1 TaxID=1313304 RepID=U7DA28_9BACT|nr:hypothetical protein [Chitinivibrio alkaliphilus]ERP31957.1 hypothetical protein CALK_1177 [Chitinivibrio alkaliphilus ACht1]